MEKGMRAGLIAAHIVCGFFFANNLLAQTVFVAPPPANSFAVTSVQIPKTAPVYFGPQYRSMLSSPLPAVIQLLSTSNNAPAVLHQSESYLNADGAVGFYEQSGSTITANNAFFKALGTNGRTCFSCHQPASGMGISASAIQLRFLLTGGRDPIFAPVDGANCPNNVAPGDTSGALLGGKKGEGHHSFYDAHSLLLRKGLIRVALPVPTQTNHDLSPHATEFTVAVVSDPYGCNTDPTYAQSMDANGAITQMVSVYRRPRMSANLKSMTTSLANIAPGFPPLDLISGYPLDVALDPITQLPILDANGNPIPLSGNIMWDGREKTLESQAVDATLGHAQALTAPTPEQVTQMVAFETNAFSAQALSFRAGDLTDKSASSVVHGGPQYIANQPVTFGALNYYDAWQALPADPSASFTLQQQASIGRGQAIFNTKPMIVSNVVGFNNFPGVAANAQATCNTCHGANGGNDALPRNQRNIGIAGDAVQFGGPALARDLPIFQLTCKPGFSTVFGGTTVQTNDPGLALITGKCADIGRTSVPQLRALSARAPYFSNGSAATLLDVVNFYNARFSIGYTDQEKQDLVNFLRTL